MSQAHDFFDEPTEGCSVPAQDAAYEAWFRRKVEAGLQDAREGRVVSHEQIKADAKARREKLLAVKQVS